MKLFECWGVTKNCKMEELFCPFDLIRDDLQIIIVFWNKFTRKIWISGVWAYGQAQSTVRYSLLTDCTVYEFKTCEPCKSQNLQKFEIFAKYCYAVPCIDVISQWDSQANATQVGTFMSFLEYLQRNKIEEAQYGNISKDQNSWNYSSI